MVVKKSTLLLKPRFLIRSYHKENHPIPVKGGGARVYVDQDNIRCVWGHNQGQLLKEVANLL